MVTNEIFLILTVPVCIALLGLEVLFSVMKVESFPTFPNISGIPVHWEVDHFFSLMLVSGFSAAIQRNQNK